MHTPAPSATAGNGPGPYRQGQVFWNLSAAAIVEKVVQNRETYRTESGALVDDSGEFTDDRPQEIHVVRDEVTAYTIWWGGANKPVSPVVYGRLYARMQAYLQTRDCYVHDAYACAHPVYRHPIRIITTRASHCHFCHQFFLCPTSRQRSGFRPAFTLLCAPDFQADPATGGVGGKGFILINLRQRILLLGGIANAGAIREATGLLLNYLLPHKHGVLPLYCSVSEDQAGHTALFFGLPGTGKTTLAADGERNLAGEEGHGWDSYGVFNFEGRRFPQVVSFRPAAESPGTPGGAEGGRTAERGVPGPPARLSFISNASAPAISGIPQHLFFLTADASGVLPLVSRLNTEQAMFYFFSGYSADTRTENAGPVPRRVFAPLFGAPFVLLPPAFYAEFLGRKIRENQVQVWLLNTGWIGGSPPQVSRVPVQYTRAAVRAVLAQQLNQVSFTRDPVFGLAIPQTCPGVPEALLNPRRAWRGRGDYESQAHQLAWDLLRNLDAYKGLAHQELARGAPVICQQVFMH